MSTSGLPSISEIRRLTDLIGEEIDPRSNRRVSKDADLYQIQIAIKYQFLIAAEVSEVSGPYRPTGEPLKNAHSTKIENENVAIFFTKKNRQIKENEIQLKGTCIPLNKEFEPWAQEVFDYVTDNPEPFSFNENPLSSKRQLEGAIEEIFKPVRWDNSIYNKIMFNQRTESKWADFKSNCVKKARLLDLKLNYEFDRGKLFSFTSYLDDYDNIDYAQPQKAFQLFRRIGESYFKSLCKRTYSIHTNI